MSRCAAKSLPFPLLSASITVALSGTFKHSNFSLCVFLSGYINQLRYSHLKFLSLNNTELLRHLFYSTHKTGTTSSGISFFPLCDLVYVKDMEMSFWLLETRRSVSALLGSALQCVDQLLWVHRKPTGRQVPV